MNNTRWLSRSAGLGQYAGTWAQAPSGTAMFIDRNGVNRTDYICGEYFRYAVKDYSHVWLTQYKDGGLQYDAPYSVPAAYTSVCATDPGVYHGTVYELLPDGTKGAFLSDSLATIYLPQDNPGLLDTIENPPQPYGIFGMDAATVLMVGGSVLALMMMRKK